MLKVGLTGGIASGKSLVGGIFAQLGAEVIQADSIAHELMQPGRPVYDEIVRRFGHDILHPDGTIDRARLAEAAFASVTPNNPPRIAELNRIVHPAVVEYQDGWMAEVGRHDRKAVAVVEAALILEAHAASHFDKLVVVTCRPEQRIERWAKRVGVDENTARNEITRRMAAQLPDEEKVKAADYVIDNSGSIEQTRIQAERVFDLLRSETVGQ